MKVLSVFGFVCFLTLEIAAQNGYTIQGKVSDSGGPVRSVVVTLAEEASKQIRYTAVTDDAGEYRLQAAPGRYLLEAKKMGVGRVVGTASATVDIRVDDSQIIDLRLAEPGAISETVTISADAEQPIEQVSKSVNAISGQEMRDRADFALADALRTIPGFRVQQLGGFGRTATIKSRGLRNQDTAILIDGIRFRDASAITGDASPFISDFTLTSVSKIEVLRGSGSSLYGTNAIGGTVDFQTPVPKPGFHGQISTAFGGLGLGRFRGNVSDGTGNGKFGYNLAVSRTAYTKGIDGQDNAHNTNFQSRIEYNPFSGTNISGRLFISDAFVRLNSSPDTLDPIPASNSTIIDANPGVNFTPDPNDPDSTQRSKFFNGQIAVSQIINTKVFLTGYYSGLKTSRKNDNGVLGVPFQSASTSFFDGTIQTANATLNWTPNRINSIKVGYEFEHEKFGNDGRTPSGTANFFTRAYQSSNTLFVQDRVSLLGGNLQLAGGFRVQRFKLIDPKFSLVNAPYANLSLDAPPSAYIFDGAASYYIAKTRTKIRAHAGNGYRVPSLYERFGTFFSTFFGPEFVALGDPMLKPEKTVAFDSGVEQNVFGDKARLTAVYFYSKLVDTIGFGSPVPNIGNTTRPFGGYENQKGGIARGGEFSASVKATRSTDIFTSYTFTNSDQREAQVSGSGVIETLGIPKHQFTLVATQRFKRFWVNVDLLATSNYLAPMFSNSTFNSYVYRFDGNRRADLTAGYTFLLNKEKFTLRLFGTIENLFDHEYFENGFQTVGRNGRVGISFGF